MKQNLSAVEKNSSPLWFNCQISQYKSKAQYILNNVVSLRKEEADVLKKRF
jgi:hypothetical protein